jgi:ABC-type multidrug transport system permease subunit
MLLNLPKESKIRILFAMCYVSLLLLLLGIVVLFNILALGVIIIIIAIASLIYIPIKLEHLFLNPKT